MHNIVSLVSLSLSLSLLSFASSSSLFLFFIRICKTAHIANNQSQIIFNSNYLFHFNEFFRAIFYNRSTHLASIYLSHHLYISTFNNSIYLFLILKKIQNPTNFKNKEPSKNKLLLITCNTTYY
jgi:hypothetical protein